jgi:hypothetical protein
MVTDIRPEADVMAEHKERMEKLKRIEEAKTLPRMDTEDADVRNQEPFTAKVAEDAKEEEPAGVLLIHTENTDLKTGEQGLPRMDAEERGSEAKNLPLINTEDTDRDEAIAKMLPQSVGGEVYANRSQTSEVHANLG